jgi:enoyl-CoA hydratase/carnithine racemase
MPELQRLLRTEDAAEGMRAFRERRPGNFTGR